MEENKGIYYNFEHSNKDDAVKEALSRWTGQLVEKNIFLESDTWCVSWHFKDNKPTYYYQESNSPDFTVFYKGGSIGLKRVKL